MCFSYSSEPLVARLLLLMHCSCMGRHGARPTTLANLMVTPKTGQFIDTTSRELGQFLLNGWVMMEKCCHSCNAPLMRSKDASIQFCVNCDTHPSCSAWDSADAVGWTNAADPNDAAGIAAAHSTQMSESPNGTTLDQNMDEDGLLEREIAAAQQRLRSEARQTSVNSHVDSPFRASASSVVDTSAAIGSGNGTASVARVETQSDCASKAIARLMLRNWALLGAECPNESCIGIPLMRNPQKRQEMFCVICERTYTDPSTQSANAAQSANATHSANSTQSANATQSVNATPIMQAPQAHSAVIHPARASPTGASVSPIQAFETISQTQEPQNDEPAAQAVSRHLALLTDRLRSINEQMSRQHSTAHVVEARQIMESMEVAQRLLK